jgi:hypothetical protein
MQQRLRLAGGFVLLGLAVEAIALRWAHPVAFLVLGFIGIPLAGVGMAVYLYSLVSLRSFESQDLKATTTATRTTGK